ncbi:hypothetical protein MYX76_03740 [Desulfobacterota bacterium AH_259_B03_O07]|nr:hypothetical protein [Desulfobacterota bacterium AH_259_B03_O07]
MARRYEVKAVTSYEGIEDIAEKVNKVMEGIPNGLLDIKLYESLSDRPGPGQGQGKGRINSIFIIVDRAIK